MNDRIEGEDYLKAAKSIEEALLEKFDSREECTAALAVARMLIVRGMLSTTSWTGSIFRKEKVLRR